MKIAIAARGVGEVSGGAKEYIISMLKNLPEAGSEHEFVFYYDDKQYIGEFSAANVTEKLIKSLPVFKYARKFIWDHLQLPIQILIDKPDVVFHPKI